MESRKPNKSKQRNAFQKAAFPGSPRASASPTQQHHQQVNLMDIIKNNNDTNNNNNNGQLVSGFVAIGNQRGSCFKSASSRSPNKVHWEKSLQSSPSSSSLSSPSSSSRMASFQSSDHQSSSYSPSTSRAKPKVGPSSPSSSSSPSATCQISRNDSYTTTTTSRARSHSTSSSSSSSSSSPSPSLSSSPSFAGAKWQADPPVPNAVPKPPKSWLGTAEAADVAGGFNEVVKMEDAEMKKEKSRKKKERQQQQQKKQRQQQQQQREAVMAAGAAFPTQMRSGYAASDLRALMAPPPSLPVHTSPTSLFDQDYQIRADISNHLKALLNVAG